MENSSVNQGVKGERKNRNEKKECPTYFRFCYVFLCSDVKVTKIMDLKTRMPDSNPGSSPTISRVILGKVYYFSQSQGFLSLKAL